MVYQPTCYIVGGQEPDGNRVMACELRKLLSSDGALHQHELPRALFGGGKHDALMTQPPKSRPHQHQMQTRQQPPSPPPSPPLPPLPPTPSSPSRPPPAPVPRLWASERDTVPRVQRVLAGRLHLCHGRLRLLPKRCGAEAHMDVGVPEPVHQTVGGSIHSVRRRHVRLRWKVGWAWRAQSITYFQIEWPIPQ